MENRFFKATGIYRPNRRPAGGGREFGRACFGVYYTGRVVYAFGKGTGFPP